MSSSIRGTFRLKSYILYSLIPPQNYLQKVTLWWKSEKYWSNFIKNFTMISSVPLFLLCYFKWHLEVCTHFGQGLIQVWWRHWQPYQSPTSHILKKKVQSFETFPSLWIRIMFTLVETNFKIDCSISCTPLVVSWSCVVFSSSPIIFSLSVGAENPPFV